jgi:hypothetical protein
MPVKIINILCIVFPLLIIVFGLIRYYTDGKRSFGGLINFLALLLLLMGLARFFLFPGGGGGSNSSGPMPDPLPVSKHSDAFNNSMGVVINSYYKMTDGFVNWDTAVIQAAGKELKTALDSLNIEELKKDTTGIYESALDPLANAKAEVAAIIADPSIAEKRGSLNILSDQIRTLWSVVKYDREKAYWMECPMAFGDDKPGNWLSRTEEVVNPYLGKKDPQYGDGMLHCGESKVTIDFVPPPAPDTTKKK